MQSMALFTTAFVVGLSGAMMPGPLLTATMASSAQRGFWAGPQIVFGHALLELALILALLAGASRILVQPRVTDVIAVTGGGFLLYLGGSMLRDAVTGRAQMDSVQQAPSSLTPTLLHPVWAGILISLGNPYWSVWWATVGLSYLTLSLKSGSAGIVSFFSGHILADLAWYTLVAAAVAGGRNYLTPRLYQGFLAACGLFILALGGYFIYGGVR